jgi:hypothetical protein
LRGAQAVSAFNELHAGGFFAGADLSCADAPKLKADTPPRRKSAD